MVQRAKEKIRILREETLGEDQEVEAILGMEKTLEEGEIPETLEEGEIQGETPHMTIEGAIASLGRNPKYSMEIAPK